MKKNNDIETDISRKQNMFDYKNKFIGRKKETDELLKSIRNINHGQFGGIVYLDGISGIGKSRFVNEFVSNLKGFIFLKNILFLY